MKIALGVTTFLAVGAGAVGAAALNNVQMQGTDTLFEVTQDLLAVCPGASGITFRGGGSSGPETAMKTAGTAPNPQQTIAPMARFLVQGASSNSCTIASAGGGAWGAPSTAEGLVIGMDAVSLVAAKSAGGSAVCNGAIEDCDELTDPGSGLRYSGSIAHAGGAYTLGNWRDVLRIVFAGMSATAQNNIAMRDCNSSVRRALVDNYNSIFQTPENCTSGNCAQLRHAFIPANESGATDAFVSLLGLTSINLTNNASPFCNALRTSDPLPGAAGEVARYFADFQDFDPIRRDCSTREQVCHKNGNAAVGSDRMGLGLVLTIIGPDFVATDGDAFPTEPCQSGNFTYVPLVPQSTGLPVVRRCPNGDVAAFDSNCQYPAAAGSQRFKCLNGTLNRPSFILNNAPIEGRAPSLADGRVYNLHLLKNPVPPAVDPTYETDLRNRRTVGAFFRIHSTQSIASPDVQCRHRNASTQIGCLVSASPCSIGAAGRVAIDGNPGTAALKVRQTAPAIDCIEQQSYPLSRKLFVNTFQGFEDPDLQTQEFELARCFADPAKIGPILTARGFISFSSASPSGGGPYCEDFNETQCAGAPLNVDACLNNPVGIPTGSTTCGDGAREFGEACDDGNNLFGDGCSSFCQRED